MASSDQRAYVYLQLPQSLDVVTTGFYELDFPQGAPMGSFVYNPAYLQRADAVPLDPYELPLASRRVQTVKLKGIFGPLRDASPDAWGRRITEPATIKPDTAGDRSFTEWLPLLPPHLGELAASLDGYVSSLGDDVQRQELKRYVAFKRLKNFATLVPQKNRLLLYLRLDPAQMLPLPANARDVRQQGHWGTGDLELALTSLADLDAAKPLILMAYEGRAGFAASKATPNSGS